jgi:hypothetical protein
VAAIEFWRNRRNSQALRHRRWASQIYSEAFARHATRFWADRCREAPEAPSPAITTALPDPDQFIAVAPNVKLVLAPCLAGHLVKRLECVDHTSLTEPVAFAAGTYVSPLLRRAILPAAAREILGGWSESIPPTLACTLLSWAWRRGILVAASEARRPTGR